MILLVSVYILEYCSMFLCLYSSDQLLLLFYFMHGCNNEFNKYCSGAYLIMLVDRGSLHYTIKQLCLANYSVKHIHKSIL